jgi:uncharacterized protein
MRRKDREVVDRAAMDDVLGRALACRIAMVDGKEPYMVALSFGYGDNALHIHCAQQGRKIDILKKNPHVCFSADVDTSLVPGTIACGWGMKFKSVVGFGKAEFVEGPAEKKRSLNFIMKKYALKEFDFPPEEIAKIRIIRIPIERMTMKAIA